MRDVGSGQEWHTQQLGRIIIQITICYTGFYGFGDVTRRVVNNENLLMHTFLSIVDVLALF